ncbi:MAG: hypothetical protein LQ346_001138 [Caloplaca aetnensis]|nr:MAG: hypothetical protein LQ346_001138 [Caloplaca aetnensis]
MPRAKEVTAPPKKERLTLSQLASYDDILTDALVDHAYFWTAIRKNRSKYNLTRGISEDDVTRILLQKVIVNKDVEEAESSLLQLPGLRKFHSALKSDREREDFRRHMRKYISMWLPDCPFEVSTTNRYTIVTHEAAVTARREIKRGETVKYLVGNLVAMTPEEEKDLDLTRRDFSIVMSSRRRTPSLFLGPARFANHDCNANARLVTHGSEGMQVVAARDIGIDEEITVTYGENYFGESNCECLCLTCENAGRGQWAGACAGAARPSTLHSEDDGEKLLPRALRPSTRKRSRLSEQSNSPNPEIGVAVEVEVERQNKRRKTKATRKEETEKVPGMVIESPKFIGRSSLRGSKKRARPDEEETPANHGIGVRLSRKRTKMETPEHLASLKDRTHGQKIPGSLKVTGYHTPGSPATSESRNRKPILPGKMPPTASPMADSIFDELSAALKKKPLQSRPGAVGKQANPSGPSELIEDDVQVLELVPPTPNDGTRPALQGRDQPIKTPISSSDQDSLFSHSNAQVSSPATTPGPSEEPELDCKVGSQHNPDGSDGDGDLSELDPDSVLDDDSMTVLEKSPKHQRASRGSKIMPTIEVEDASLRIPGDYTRTPLLLGEKYSRWVDCRTCSGCWVQQNGYQTRKECPRCERHSKL